MDYLEACEAIVTRREAMREIRRHGASWSEFIADCGDAEEYQGLTVLNWLGY